MRRLPILPVVIILAGVFAFVGGSAAGAGAIAHKPIFRGCGNGWSRQAATTSSH
jgi:hypothetical protein